MNISKLYWNTFFPTSHSLRRGLDLWPDRTAFRVFANSTVWGSTLARQRTVRAFQRYTESKNRSTEILDMPKMLLSKYQVVTKYSVEIDISVCIVFIIIKQKNWPVYLKISKIWHVLHLYRLYLKTSLKLKFAILSRENDKNPYDVSWVLILWTVLLYHKTYTLVWPFLCMFNEWQHVHATRPCLTFHDGVCIHVRCVKMFDVVSCRLHIDHCLVYTREDVRRCPGYSLRTRYGTYPPTTYDRHGSAPTTLTTIAHRRVNLAVVPIPAREVKLV